MNRWAEGRRERRVRIVGWKERTDRINRRSKHEWMFGRKEKGRVNGWIDGRRDGWSEGRISRQMDGWMSG